MPDNPILEQLIDIGGGEALAFAGHLSTTEDGRIRLYQTLSTDAFIEMAREDILYIREPREKSMRTLIYLKGDANLRVVFDRTLNLRELTPVRAPSAPRPPDQPSGGKLSADSPAALTHCAGGLEVVFCERIIDGGWGYDVRSEYNGHVFGSAHLNCGPSNEVPRPC